MSIFKNLGQNDSVASTTNLHEQIPITGTLLSSGSTANVYDGTFPSESNIKYFSNNDHLRTFFSA